MNQIATETAGSDDFDFGFLTKDVEACISTDVVPARKFLSAIVELFERADENISAGGPDVSCATKDIKMIRDCVNSDALLSPAQQRLINDHLRFESENAHDHSRNNLFLGGYAEIMSVVTFINSCRG